ncbi:hypothetical protein [Pediococcus pentosaceus]|uniref:hypothetical protein n=1 Tax=Pediococcus pentosaceus TaxID=1255 RepID=UPI000852A388|nr:hypothetical protein [Pediococcus pentosaceus]
MKELDLPLAAKRSSLKKYVDEGSGDDAHMPADNQHSGFITAEMYKQLLSAIGDRKHVDDASDIYELDPGRYFGQNLKNAPTGAATALLFIDVDRADQTNDHKEYKVVVAYTGQTYYRNKHVNSGGANASTPLGWSTVEKYYPLWEGNVSAADTVLTITDNIYKFKKVRLTLNDSNSGEHDITVPRAGAMIAYLTYPWLSQHGVSFFGIALKIKDASDNGGTKLIVDRNYSYSLTDQWTDNTRICSLKKIEGVF